MPPSTVLRSRLPDTTEVRRRVADLFERSGELIDKYVAIVAGALAVLLVYVHRHRFAPGRPADRSTRGMLMSFLTIGYVMALFAAGNLSLIGCNSYLVAALLTNALGFVMDETFTRESGLRAAQEEGLEVAARRAAARLASMRFVRTAILGLFDMMLGVVLSRALSDQLDGRSFLLLLNLIGPLVFWTHGNALRVDWAKNNACSTGPTLNALILGVAVLFLRQQPVQREHEPPTLLNRPLIRFLVVGTVSLLLFATQFVPCDGPSDDKATPSSLARALALLLPLLLGYAGIAYLLGAGRMSAAACALGALAPIVALLVSGRRDVMAIVAAVTLALAFALTRGRGALGRIQLRRKPPPTERALLSAQ